MKNIFAKLIRWSRGTRSGEWQAVRNQKAEEINRLVEEISRPVPMQAKPQENTSAIREPDSDHQKQDKAA